MRRGWVWPIRPATPRPISRQIFGNWVDLPEPVSPQTITTWWSRMAAAMSSRRAEIGRSGSKVSFGTAFRRASQRPTDCRSPSRAGPAVADPAAFPRVRPPGLPAGRCATAAGRRSSPGEFGIRVGPARALRSPESRRTPKAVLPASGISDSISKDPPGWVLGRFFRWSVASQGGGQLYLGYMSLGGELDSTGQVEVQVAYRGWSAGHAKSRPKLNCQYHGSGCLRRQPRLRSFAGEFRLPAVIPDRFGSMLATPGIKNCCRLVKRQPCRSGGRATTPVCK